MKVNFIEINGEKKVFNYVCRGCGLTFATFLIYYPGQKICKYCPECGHKFDLGDDDGNK